MRGAMRPQVLGGAGPAIAAVPLVVVWAGGSTITLIQSVARGKVGALGSASRVGFVVTMSVGQVRTAAVALHPTLASAQP